MSDEIGGFLIFVALVSFVVWRIVERRRKTVIVYDYERGLRFVKGQFKDVVGAGRYTWLGDNQAITKVDTRVQTLTLGGQDVMTSDKATVKISFTAQYSINDAQTAMLKYLSFRESLYGILQITVREMVGNITLDQLLEQRAVFDQQIFERAAPDVANIGLNLVGFNVRDIMLSGQLKQAYSQILAARQHGLAALERARGEQAALRSLANAARVLENNPMLYQLRVLQALDESKGHTLVVQTGETNADLSMKKAE